MYPVAMDQRDKAVGLAMELLGKLFDGRATEKVDFIQSKELTPQNMHDG